MSFCQRSNRRAHQTRKSYRFVWLFLPARWRNIVSLAPRISQHIPSFVATQYSRTRGGLSSGGSARRASYSTKQSQTQMRHALTQSSICEQLHILCLRNACGMSPTYFSRSRLLQFTQLANLPVGYCLSKTKSEDDSLARARAVGHPKLTARGCRYWKGLGADLVQPPGRAKSHRKIQESVSSVLAPMRPLMTDGRPKT
jgi:hypothetical protein